MGTKSKSEEPIDFEVRIKATGERGQTLRKIVLAKKNLGHYRTMPDAVEALILENADLIDVADGKPKSKHKP